MKFEYNPTFRQKDGGWQYIISFKINNGKWQQKSKQGFSTKKEAKAAADKRVSALKLEYKRKFEDEKSIVDKDYESITFIEVAEKCIEHMKIYKEPGTVARALVSIKAFDNIHKKIMLEITKADIQSKIDSHVKNKKLKEITLKGYVTYINTVFKYYKENYYESFILPSKNLVYPKKIKCEKTALTKEELDKLLLYFRNRPADEYILCLIAATCGLRIGEILALTWNDIDEVNSELKVTKQWKKNKEGTWGFGTLKTSNSKRVVPIPPSTLKELLAFKKIWITDIHNRIIPRKSESFRIMINRHLNKVSSISVHELRHTYTTFLIATGIDYKTVAEYIGDDVQQVYKTYSHVTCDMKKEAAKKIAEIF